LRGKDRREVQDDPEGFSIEAVPSPGNLENEAARAQLMRRLRGALATLPPEQREAVELAYFEGMTQTEIAERTGSPLGTVKSRVRAAMQTLKQVFEDESTRQSRRL
jgi:RNA polymerase sigma-70 factor (ECF subfamily)